MQSMLGLDLNHDSKRGPWGQLVWGRMSAKCEKCKSRSYSMKQRANGSKTVCGR